MEITFKMICIYQVLGHSNETYCTEAKPCLDSVPSSQWEYLFALFLMLLYLFLPSSMRMQSYEYYETKLIENALVKTTT